jgi:hypothetical protein
MLIHIKHKLYGHHSYDRHFIQLQIKKLWLGQGSTDFLKL